MTIDPLSAVRVVCEFLTSREHHHLLGLNVQRQTKAKAGMVRSVVGLARGVEVKLGDPLRTRAIPERLRGVFTTRRYTNTRVPLLYLTLPWMLTTQVAIWLRLLLVRSL